jgi:hypothetical protein
MSSKLNSSRCNHQSRVKPTMPGTSNLIFLGVGQWGQFFIVHKPYKNMLNVGDRLVSQERRRLKRKGDVHKIISFSDYHNRNAGSKTTYGTWINSRGASFNFLFDEVWADFLPPANQWVLAWYYDEYSRLQRKKYKESRQSYFDANASFSPGFYQIRGYADFSSFNFAVRT